MERAIESFRIAAEDRDATFWEPDGLPVSPLAALRAGLSSGTPR
jgi:hypothetical protein